MFSKRIDTMPVDQQRGLLIRSVLGLCSGAGISLFAHVLAGCIIFVWGFRPQMGLVFLMYYLYLSPVIPSGAIVGALSTVIARYRVGFALGCFAAMSFSAFARQQLLSDKAGTRDEFWEQLLALTLFGAVSLVMAGIIGTVLGIRINTGREPA